MVTSEIGYSDSTIINNLMSQFLMERLLLLLDLTVWKSTLLKALSRLLSIKEGKINLMVRVFMPHPRKK